MKTYYFKLQIIDEKGANIPLIMPIQKKAIKPKDKIITLIRDRGEWFSSKIKHGIDFIDDTQSPKTTTPKKNVW